MSRAELTFEEMEFLCKKLIIFAKKWGIKDVSFEDKDDYYFKIWHEHRKFTLEFLNNPEYTLQSLDDDISGLKRLLDDEEIPTTLDLERFGAIFTALGATMLEKADLSEK